MLSLALRDLPVALRHAVLLHEKINISLPLSGKGLSWNNIVASFERSLQVTVFAFPEIINAGKLTFFPFITEQVRGERKDHEKSSHFLLAK